MTRPQTTEQHEPLRAWRQFEGHDFDQVRALVAGKFCDHSLRPLGAPQNTSMRYNHVRGQALSLNYLSYGSAVEINPGELQDFYLVQLPVSGQALVANGAEPAVSDPGLATVLNPSRETRMTWHTGCRMLLLQISREALHATAERATGLPLCEGVMFRTAVPLENGALRDWMRQFSACVAATENKAGFGSWNSMQQTMIEEQLILGLLTHQDSNIRHLMKPKSAPSNCQMRRARDFIHANASEPLTVSAIAAAAGCSIRSLQAGFRSQLSLTPMQYLCAVRLDMARYLLLSQPAGTPVSSIAYDCGFSHLGRFSRLYRDRFGELPRDTSPAQGNLQRSG